MLISGACGSEFGAVFLLWGGNCNNALLCGAAFNVNNAFSNANWNIGPSPTYRNHGAVNQMLPPVLPHRTLQHVYPERDRGKIKPAPVTG